MKIFFSFKPGTSSYSNPINCNEEEEEEEEVVKPTDSFNNILKQQVLDMKKTEVKRRMIQGLKDLQVQIDFLT